MNKIQTIDAEKLQQAQALLSALEAIGLVEMKIRKRTEQIEKTETRPAYLRKTTSCVLRMSKGYSASLCLEVRNLIPDRYRQFVPGEAHLNPVDIENPETGKNLAILRAVNANRFALNRIVDIWKTEAALVKRRTETNLNRRIRKSQKELDIAENCQMALEKLSA